MLVVAVVGGFTALFAATIGLAQNDIKKVLAYSTVSQLGYMFLACGVGAFVAGMFHVMTHAFFKACLFLGSGSVIHALGGEQDIRKMGGLSGKFRRPIEFASRPREAGVPLLPVLSKYASAAFLKRISKGRLASQAAWACRSSPPADRLSCSASSA